MRATSTLVALKVFGRNMRARWVHLCRLGLRPDRVGSETQPTLVAAGPCLRKAAALLLLTVVG